MFLIHSTRTSLLLGLFFIVFMVVVTSLSQNPHLSLYAELSCFFCYSSVRDVLKNDSRVASSSHIDRQSMRAGSCHPLSTQYQSYHTFVYYHSVSSYSCSHTLSCDSFGTSSITIALREYLHRFFYIPFLSPMSLLSFNISDDTLLWFLFHEFLQHIYSGDFPGHCTHRSLKCSHFCLEKQ